MAMDQLDEGKKPADEMSFLEHLEALRWHILRSFAAIVVAGIGVFLAKDFVFHSVIFAPKRADFITYRVVCRISEFLCFEPAEFTIITRDLGEQFIVHLKSSFWIGLIIAFPYVFWQLWKFVKPGLYEREQKATRGVVLICSLLFVTGVLFGYFIISPFAISFLSSYSVGATSAPTLASYISYMTMFTIPSGLVFELPIVVYFLAKLGVVGPKTMRQFRRHAIVVILVLSSIITPPDMVTQLLISFPLYFLYEISIIIAARVIKNREEI